MADQNPDEPRDCRIATLAFNCCYLVLGVLLCMVLRGEGTVAMLPFLAGGLAMNLLCAQLLQANSGSRRHRVTWRLALCQLPFYALVTGSFGFFAFASSFMTGETPAAREAILLM